MADLHRLRVLCPQEYEGVDNMNVTACTRCHVGWNEATRTCTIETGAEHLEPVDEPPSCPIADRCQHQLQSTSPCVVRSKGLVCESALVFGGMNRDEASGHPLSFNACMMDAP